MHCILMPFKYDLRKLKRDLKRLPFLKHSGFIPDHWLGETYCEFKSIISNELQRRSSESASLYPSSQWYLAR